MTPKTPRPKDCKNRVVRSHTRGLIVVALFVVIGASPAAARIRTQATIFRAFNSAGAPTIRVQPRSGYCFTGSAAANRSDAWRCFVGNVIYDPCFSSTRAPGVVICPNRQVNGGIRIRLTRPLPRRFANRRSPSLANRPWNIQLANGRRCVYSSGATNVIQGVRLNYFCPPGTGYGLWGIPNRRAQPWTIRSAPFTATRLGQRRIIRRAWM